MTTLATEDAGKIHERLNEVVATINEVKLVVERIDVRCKPCQDSIAKLNGTIYGNGGPGLVTKIATAEATSGTSKVDTLTIKGVCTLVAAVGALAATIGGAMAALVK